MSGAKSVIERLRFVPEAIVLVMAGLAPWAIGAVDAWAQLILEGGIVLLTILGLLLGDRSHGARRLLCVPSLALASLAMLALLQSIPLPVVVLKAIAPATYLQRAGLAPDFPQSVKGYSGLAVSPPAATLSQDADASIRTAAQLAASWLLFQGVLGLGRGPGPLRRFAWLTVTNATLMTLFSIVQALTWNGKIYGIRPTGTESGWLTGGPFVSHNHLAAYLNIGFGVALGFLLASIQEVGRSRGTRTSRGEGVSSSLWAGTAAGIIFAGILASHSRGGFLAAVTSTAVTILVLRPRTVRAGVSLGVVVVVTVLFLIVMGSTSPFERLATIKDSARQDGFGTRFVVWEVVLRTWSTFPIWGTGLGSFPAATGPFYPVQFQTHFFSHAESEYLHILTEGGIVGLGLALLALATIARLGNRAMNSAPSSQERALILGALAAVMALSIQCLSDFPLHIPGVAVSAVILTAHLSRLGLEAGERAGATVADPSRGPARVGPWLGGLAMVGLSLAVFAQGVSLARAEALVRSVGLPFPGSTMPSVDTTPPSLAELKRMRAALEAALRLRPDWAEGHLRLGATLLGLYSNLAAEFLGQFQEEKDPATVAILSDPLWLHGVVHGVSAEDLAAAGGVLDHEPVQSFLIPAARSFLEARRCSPDLALAHARLASIDYLLVGGESTSVHAARALRMTGYDYHVLLLAGKAAADAGDLDLAALCWQKSLRILGRNEGWEAIAAVVSALLSPDQVLQKVLPPGARFPLLFADEIYNDPESQEARTLCLRTALKRLPDEIAGPTERLWLEAQIRARLDERERAQKLMNDALVEGQTHPEWREEYIDWLTAWGNFEEASRQARIGLTLFPDHAGIQRASKSALDAFAKGATKSEGPG